MVELGAGLGLVGILLAKLGAQARLNCIFDGHTKHVQHVGMLMLVSFVIEYHEIRLRFRCCPR